MGRLMRFSLALAVLLGVCAPAHADPISIMLTLSSFVGTTAAAFLVSYGASIAFVGASLFSSARAKKKAARAAARALDAEIAKLKDRTATILSSDPAWVTVYGAPSPIGGSPVAVLVSGEFDQFKHVVFVLASHECEAIDAIYLGGEDMALDGNGYATHADYQLAEGVRREESFAFTITEQAAGEGGPIYAAQIPVTADRSPVFLRVVDADGVDVSDRLTWAAPHRQYGASLVGSAADVGLTGTVTVSVNGAGSAVHVSKHLSPGGVDVADARLMAACPDKWTAAHRLSGYTYIVITFNLNLDSLQGGIPEITARVRGKKVYDPRTGQVAYSRNPALCLGDFITARVGYGATALQIETDAWIAAANACDVYAYNPADAAADPATYGGVPQLYVADGVLSSDQDLDTSRQQIEESMAGYCLLSGGVWRMLAGAWSTPVMALTDADMLGPTTITQTCNPGTDRVNTVRGSYVNAARLGVSEDITPYVNQTWRGLDGIERALDLPFSFTGSHARCHQLARVRVEQSRGGLVLNLTPKMSAWWLQPGDRIVYTSALYGFANKTFRVQEWSHAANRTVGLQVVEDEPTFYDLVDEVAADPAPNTNLQNPFERPIAPMGLTLASGPDHMLQQGANLIARTLVTWVQTTDARVLREGAVRVQWSGDTGGARDWANITLPGDATSTYLTDLQIDQGLLVRVRFETPYTSSDWAYSSHLVDGLGAPGAVQGLAVSVTETGLQARWQEPAGLDVFAWGATHIREGTTWAGATELFVGQALNANIGWLQQGPRRIWAAHYTVDGTQGTPANVVFTVNAPASPLITARRTYTSMRLAWQDCRTTQPLDHYQVSKGATLETAVALGRTASTHFDVTGITDGAHRVWVVAVDVAGNQGGPAFVDFDGRLDIDQVLDDIEGRILGGMLAPGLLAKIDDAATVKESLAATVLNSMLTADESLKKSAVRAATATGQAVAAIEELRVQTATSNEALASVIDVVAAELDDAKAAIVDEATARATAVEAVATSLEVVAAELDDAKAAIVDEATARATAVEAVATSLEVVAAELDDAVASAATKTQVAADIASANAAQNTVLRAEIGSAAAAAQLAFDTAADLSGNVSASAMLKTEVLSNGKRYLAGLAVGVSADSSGAVQSEVIVNAWNFAVINSFDNGGNPVVPFAVVDGVTYLRAAVIKDADIGTLKIAGNAVMLPVSSTSSGAHPSVSMYIDVPCKVLVHCVVVYPESTSGTAPPSFPNFRCVETGQTFGIAVASPSYRESGGSEGSTTYIGTTCYCMGELVFSSPGWCTVVCDGSVSPPTKGVMLALAAKR